jgi:hypothetical protein
MLRGPGRRMYAIDLFEELQADVAYGSGAHYREIFEKNMRSFFGPLDFLKPITAASGALRSSDFTGTFSFCHVDGGHSPQETYSDLKFASDILMPGGLVALDDYFNPQHPGVCEGAIDFARRHEGALRPLAVGYNKVLFQKQPASIDLNARFQERFRNVRPEPAADMWGSPIFLFDKPLRSYIDLYGSTPGKLIPLDTAPVRATFSLKQARVVAQGGKPVKLPVTVMNTSNEEFPGGADVFGVSYHLLSGERRLLQHDNARSYLLKPLAPGERVNVDLLIEPPQQPGRYRLEIDLVWEGVMWFKDVGNPTAMVEMEVA